jgi:homoserine O-succinyltransferase
VGFLNMMPDAALAATEQQFFRLIAASDVAANVYVYPFSIEELRRGEEAMARISEHYFNFHDLAESGLQAMIFTGANVIDPDIQKEPIWEPLIEIADWAHTNVTSTLCSCLASHALVKHSYDIDRQRFPRKHWGVFSHRVVDTSHPLMNDVPVQFDAPHSRWNDISQSQLEEAGFTVLAAGDEAGVHLAVSEDQFRIIFTQGHPEYDANSLLKEYKREVFRFFDGELESPPPYPVNYLSPEAKEIATEFIGRFLESADPDRGFPEDQMSRFAINSWSDAGSAIIRNWLRLVQRTASPDRRQQFAVGIDPSNPLDIDL